tara:strand:+ start:21 stop:275 length:255 start_codon:yes stop_codon:yes gene_type:complete
VVEGVLEAATTEISQGREGMPTIAHMVAEGTREVIKQGVEVVSSKMDQGWEVATMDNRSTRFQHTDIQLKKVHRVEKDMPVLPL